MRKWLIELRGCRSQTEIANLCGISQSFYSLLESGTREPSVTTAKRIASVLSFDWTSFFEEDVLDNETSATKETA